jgi:hypothetical protein
MTWGKRKQTEQVEEPRVPGEAIGEVMVVKSKYESRDYYSVKLEHTGSIISGYNIETVELRPRSQEEYDSYEVGQRVSIGVQPWLTVTIETTGEVNQERAS